MIDLLATQILNGVTMGLIFASVALGLTVVLGLMGVLNFAHGSLYMLGGYMTYVAHAHFGSFWLGLLISAVVCAAVGFLLFIVIVRPLTKHDAVAALLALVGVSMIFQQVARSLFGAEPKLLPIPFGTMQINFAGLSFTYPVYFLVATAASAIVLGGLALMFRFSDVGIRCLASIQDRDIAGAMGVNVTLISSLMFTIGMAVAGFAGGLAGPIFSVYPNMGIEVIGILFVIAIVGGMGSIAGTVLASLMIALTKSVSSVFFSGNVSDILAFSLLLVILLIRPRGLMGVKSVMD